MLASEDIVTICSEEYGTYLARSDLANPLWYVLPVASFAVLGVRQTSSLRTQVP